MSKIELSEQVKQKESRLAHERMDSVIRHMREVGIRQDALQFSKNQLEQLSSTIYDVLYSNPRDLFVFLPLNTEVADGMTEYSYRMIEDLGAAKVVADGSTDRPMVEKDLTKTTVDIYEFGAGYTYTVGDQARSGAILDFPYVQQKAALAAETIALAHNQFGLLGGAAVDEGPTAVEGFLNQSGITPTTLTDEDWGTPPTGLVMYNSIRDLIQAVNNQSDGVHSATDCALSVSIWNHLQGTLLDTAGSSQTVLAALRQNYPEVSFRKTASCNGVGAGGDDRNVAWERSAANAEYVASVVYDESAPIMSGFRWTIHSRGRAAGCVVRRPLSISYGDIAI